MPWTCWRTATSSIGSRRARSRATTNTCSNTCAHPRGGLRPRSPGGPQEATRRDSPVHRGGGRRADRGLPRCWPTTGRRPATSTRPLNSPTRCGARCQKDGRRGGRGPVRPSPEARVGRPTRAAPGHRHSMGRDAEELGDLVAADPVLDKLLEETQGLERLKVLMARAHTATDAEGATRMSQESIRSGPSPCRSRSSSDRRWRYGPGLDDGRQHGHGPRAGRSSLGRSGSPAPFGSNAALCLDQMAHGRYLTG